MVSVSPVHHCLVVNITIFYLVPTVLLITTQEIVVVSIVAIMIIKGLIITVARYILHLKYSIVYPCTLHWNLFTYVCAFMYCNS